jgi:hypothetical protein
MRTPRTFSTPFPILAIFLLAFSPASLNGQQRWNPEALGPNVAIASYPAVGFTMDIPNSVFQYDADVYRYSTTLSACFVAPVQLPSGVRILAMALEGCDTSPSQELVGYLRVCPTSDPCGFVFTANSSGTPGCTQFVSPVVDVQVDNMTNSYSLEVCNYSFDNTTKFRTVKLLYVLQLSPAPAAATFADVPTTHLYFRAIEALARSGITSGCGGGNYCPNQAVTRGELAKFLAVALGLGWGP